MKHVTVLLLTVVLLALLALAGGAAAEPAAPDAYSFPIPGEPNDTFATANDAYEGYLMTPTDVDYLRLDLPVPYRLRPGVGIYSADNSPVVLRVELALYDTTQTLLAEDADCDEAVALPDQFVPAGVYYLRVRACAGAFDPDQPYNVDAFSYSWPYEWEPNNSRATANEFDDNEAAIAPAGDVDFYRFEGQAGETLFASLEYDYDSSFVPEMALLDASGAVLTTSGPGNLYYDLTFGGNYYIRVRSATNPTGTGYYRLYGASGSPDGSSPTDTEPNDTPAQAVPAAYGDIFYGELSDTDTVDYYRFDGQAGDKVAIPGVQFGYRDFQVALFGPTMNPVVVNAPSNWSQLPSTGVYTLAITGPDAGYWWPHYAAQIVLLTGDEPNDTMDMATDVGQAATLIVTRDYDCDTDWIRFQGRAGDVLTGVNDTTEGNDIEIHAADGTRVSNVLPADGVYYLHFLDAVTLLNDAYCMDAYSYPLTFREALWVSAAVDGLGGNAAIKRGDIATRKTAAGQWQIVFDASDVGITANLAAFERLPNGSILMSLGTAQNVPGLGKVTPQDIIRFAPTALGDTTAGTFLWFLDGSDVGLSTTGEKIDAISMQRDIQQPLRISITGAGSVPRQSGGTLKVADEDVFNYVGTFGANSVGKWRGTPNSVVPGMAREDVSGMTRVEMIPQHNSLTLLSFDSAFTIGGQAGGPFDVLIADTWRMAVQRLTDKKIDGLSVGAAWTP